MSKPGELTQEQKKHLIEHLHKNLKGACPMCLSQEWTVGPVVQALPWLNGAFVLGGGVVPMVLLVCSTCSYVAHFAAIPLGLVNDPAAEKVSAKAATEAASEPTPIDSKKPKEG